MHDGEFVSENIQQGGVAVIKWMLVPALTLIVATAAVLLYYNTGIREYRTALSYVASLSGDEKAKTSDQFYGKRDTVSLYGGILAGVWKYGIWVWGKSGLTYFSINPSTQFFSVVGCMPPNLTNISEIQRTGDSSLKVTAFSDTRSWSSQVHPGNYVTVKTETGNTVSYVEAHPDFRVSGPLWIFCNLQ